MLIYGWIPHGSKKLEDLIQINNIMSKDWVTAMTAPVVIMHDQEPLDFNLWSDNDFAQHQEYMISRFDLSEHHRSPEFLAYQKELHLRGIVSPSAGLYDLTILVHSEQNSDQVLLYQQNNFLPVYYWSHALIAADWFRYAEHDPLLKYNVNSFKHDFLIYNRAWSGSREYRLTFAELLTNKNLLDQCLTSFSAVDNGVYYTDHQFSNQLLTTTRNDLHQVFLPNQHLSSASADYNNQDYASSCMEIVLETLFDDTRLHLTEKTLRPIACGKPFMLAATPGSLQYLRDYGFETFEEYIDESYDSIIDPYKRLTAITDEMQRISTLPVRQKNLLWKNLHCISERNQQKFFSKDWQNSIEQEFYTNLNAAMSKIKTCCTGKYWHKSMSMPLTSGSTGRPLEQIQTLHQWLKDRN